MTIKLLALAASLRRDSLNKQLLALAVGDAHNAGAQVSVLDYTECTCPLYQGESGALLPAGAQQLSDAIRAHDGILLASPEYNWSMPAHLKNLIDWLSIDPSAPLKGRHALLLCASPSLRGGILGLQQLSVPLMHLGVHVYPHLVAIGDAEHTLDTQGLRNKKDATFMRECITDFVRTISAKR